MNEDLWKEESKLSGLDFGELEGTKFQIMRQGAMFGILGVAWHCIMYHEPMMTMEDNTLRIYAMGDSSECGLYAKVDFTFKDEDLNEELRLGPTNVFNWVMTALMDPDTNKRFNYPCIIEGPRIRVEVG